MSHLVHLVLILPHEIKLIRTEVVDGSNDSLSHADEELHNHLRKYLPLQKSFKMSSVRHLISRFSLWLFLSFPSGMGTVRIRTDHPDPSGIRHRHGCLSQAQVCEIYKCAISMNFGSPFSRSMQTYVLCRT